nr:sugar transferase [Maliibacterium massiliense]
MELSFLLQKKWGTRACKRALDMLFSAALLLLLSPVFAAIALCLACQSDMRVIAKQRCAGKNGRLFDRYYFKVLAQDFDAAHYPSVPQRFPARDGLCRFLQKHRLDRLPCLYNILRGDMSFVGPRAESRAYAELYTPEQCAVLLVRPGLLDMMDLVYPNTSRYLAPGEHARRRYMMELLPLRAQIGSDYIAHLSLGLDAKLGLAALLRLIDCPLHLRLPVTLNTNAA